MRPIWRFLVGQAVVLVLVVAVPGLALDKVPGIYKLAAPVYCPASQPDARVVEYYEDLGNATGTSHTLICMGPDGDVTEVGSWKPLLVVVGAFLLALESLVLPIQIIGIIRRRRRRDAPPPRPGWIPPGQDPAHPHFLD